MTQPYIPAPGVAQVNMIYTQVGEKAENVYHVLGTAPWTGDSLTALAQFFHDWESTNMVPLRNSNTECDSVVVRDMTTENGIAVEYTSGFPLIGSNASGALPNNVTIAVAWKTGLAGRSFRGRTFHIGMAQNQESLNRITPGFSTSLVTAYQKLLTPFSTLPNGGKLCVVSKRHQNAWRTTAVSTPIVNASVDQVLDSQRRRLPNHNRHH